MMSRTVHKLLTYLAENTDAAEGIILHARMEDKTVYKYLRQLTAKELLDTSTRLNDNNRRVVTYRINEKGRQVMKMLELIS